MNLKTTVGFILMAGILAGCTEISPHPYHHRVIVYQPAPVPAPVVVQEPAPVYVEEGAVVGGVVIQTPPHLQSYVWINGGWYYWHPQAQVWVHAYRQPGWAPPPHVVVYHNWSAHPMYSATVVVSPAPEPLPPAPVPVAPAPIAVAPAPAVQPVYVEEGAVYQGVVVTAPVAISSYVFVGGGWYYWHPQYHIWVHAYRPAGWHPPGTVHVYHEWSEHPQYHH